MAGTAQGRLAAAHRVDIDPRNPSLAAVSLECRDTTATCSGGRKRRRLVKWTSLFGTRFGAVLGLRSANLNRGGTLTSPWHLSVSYVRSHRIDGIDQWGRGSRAHMRGFDKGTGSPREARRPARVLPERQREPGHGSWYWCSRSARTGPTRDASSVSRETLALWCRAILRAGPAGQTGVSRETSRSLGDFWHACFT